MDDKISTKYRDRENSYDRIVQTIEGLARSKPGNYLVFFPSYEYLREVEYRFSFACPQVRTIIQKSSMNEAEREHFLSQFEEEVSETLVAFAVMGGLFGEGIDLVGDRLSGAIIVGVGLPQICLEREMIKQYFQESRGAGFEFSYVYPGMNKVLQASGRVIRSHTDKGVVILLDERFAFGNYKKLCPEHWHPIPRLSDPKSLEEILKRFWGK
jgi:DNA excision repair protein ERCC-2